MSDGLRGDDDRYPILCPDCERHLTTPYSHRRDCPHWGEVTNPRDEFGEVPT